MAIPKDTFLFDIGPAVIDLSEISAEDWAQISYRAKQIIREGQIKEVSRAYIGAFLQWVEVQKHMHERFDSKYDIMNWTLPANLKFIF